MIKESLIATYQQAKDQHHSLVDLDALSLSGYYLYAYEGDPESALNLDIQNLRVSNVVGQTAKIVIKAALSAT